MDFKNNFFQFNVIAQCRRYGIPPWQCPQFLFLVMGIVIIVTVLATFFAGAYFIENPELVALMTLGLALILFVIATVITKSFDRLAEANRMKSEFVNIVSHQLRSPITNLKWTVDILMSKNNKTREQMAEYFKRLKDSSVRMGELVNDLITVSRIQEGTLPLKREEFSLEDTIKKLIQEFKSFAQSSGVEIKVNFEENLPEIIGDPLRIKSAVENLLNNAIRYGFEKNKGQSPEKDRKIEIRLFKKDKKLYFEIKDNGMGIPEQDQKYIFKKFFRAANALKHQAKGSGLGLYITKSIIEKSKGKIGFESEENKGSTFWFTLPIH